MADVFISYNRSDRSFAAALAGELEARGFSVWWDTDIPPGRQYDDVIEAALAEARCVIALWSSNSIDSKWVRNEAGDALDRQILIPAMIAPDLRLPLEFRRVQAADLSRWQAGIASEPFEQMITEVRRLVGGAPRPVPPRPTPVPPLPPKPTPTPKAALSIGKKFGLGFLALMVMGAIAQWMERPGPQPVVGPGGNETVPAPTPSGQAGPGIDTPLQWRDYALLYDGRVRWDGRSPQAQISLRVTDGKTRRVIAQTDLAASVGSPTASRVVLSMQVGVPGDSSTQGPHSHPVNLIFDRIATDGSWQFVQNCMDPSNCYR